MYFRSGMGKIFTYIIPGAVENFVLLIGKIEFTCNDMAFRNFPFDVLNCELKFDSWELTEIYNLSKAQAAITLPMSVFIGQTEIWEFVSLNSNASMLQVPGGVSFWRLTTTLKFNRKYQYYIGNIFMPTIGLFILQISVLFLPPDCTDRPAIGMSVVLANAFIITMVFELIPQTSEIVYLFVMIETKFILSLVITCYTMVLCGFEKISFKTCRKIDITIGVFLSVFTLIADIVLVLLMTGRI